MAVYNIPAFKDADQFLQLIAAARGKLGKVRCQWIARCCNTAVTTHDSVRCALDPAAGSQLKRCSMQRNLLFLLWTRQGGTVNTDAAARIVLTDWNDGRIPYYTEPPQREAAAPEDAAIVSNWGADFDASQVSVAEQQSLSCYNCDTTVNRLHSSPACHVIIQASRSPSIAASCNLCAYAGLQPDGAAACSWTRALC